MEDKQKLVEIFTHYDGQCDSCGEPLSIDFILVSNLGVDDKYGNPVYFVIGEIDDPEVDHNWPTGKKIYCSTCQRPVLYLRSYQSVDVTKALAAVQS